MQEFILRTSFMCGLALLAAGCNAEQAQVPADQAPVAQTPETQALVIQGGTLIDGNGGAPLANSVIVIEGNRITAVGTAGEVEVPAGAEVLDANNKWIIPGLWDCQVNYSWF